jgi:hypothetical protein
MDCDWWISKHQLAQLFEKFSKLKFTDEYERMKTNSQPFVKEFCKIFFPKETGMWFLPNIWLDYPNPMAKKVLDVLEGMLID